MVGSRGVILEEILGGFLRIREKNPLVQCITNRVTINDCANGLLAIGASPVMADGEDASEMAELADALVLNIGSLRSEDKTAILGAMSVAQRRKIPIVLDPVGAGSTENRSQFCRKLLGDYPITIVRGNWSEIRAICEGTSGTRGVDSEVGGEVSPELLKEWAKKLNCVLAVTGRIDWITDGNRLLGIENGDPRLQQITGTGCMSTALCGATATVWADPFWGAVLGVLLMSLSGERAGRSLEDHEGSGTMRIKLIDELNLLTESKILSEGRLSYDF